MAARRLSNRLGRRAVFLQVVSLKGILLSPVRVIVVDDSPTMRGLITAALRADPDIDVVGSARDPYEARDAIKTLNPDVITLDVEMPRMDGIAFLEKIMRLRPLPVIIVSTLTSKGAAISIKALSLGAFDCVCKPQSGDLTDAFEGLPELVKAAALSNTKPLSQSSAKAIRRTDFTPNGNIIAMGSSTGGVEAVITILTTFPENCPPTVITQHMPETFTKNFADRLNRLCAPNVAEATDGAPLENGHIYIAPGGDAHLEVAGNTRRHCRLRIGEKENGHRPSVDVLFQSAARLYGKRAVGVILSGMGRDGASGLLAIKEAGGRTIGQDEKTCVIYGMPKVAFEMNAVERQLPLSQISAEILKLCERTASKGAAA